MNSIWKRSFALLLSFVLVFGMIPVNTFAEENAGAETTAVTEEAVAETTEATEETAEETTEATEAEEETEATEETTEATEETTEATEAEAVCDGSENCAAETHESTCQCYDWCAALGCTEDTHHPDCPWGPCTLTEGCELVKGHPGECTGADTFEGAAVAKIGQKEYSSLAEAFQEVKDNETITLVANVELTNAISFAKDMTITLDGAGKTIKPASDSPENNSALNLGQGSDSNRATRKYTIKNVVFDGWTTDHVVRLQGVTAEISNCTFQNSNQLDGLGLLTLTYTNATVSNCVFENNTCVAAIDDNSWGDDSTSTSTISGCAFEGNTCSSAGVILHSDGAGLKVENSNFIMNKVITTGNAATVYMGFNNNCVVSGCTFKDNSVSTTKSNTKRVAGAIFCDGCVVKNNAFLNNTASRAGESVTAAVAVGAYYYKTDLSENYWGDSTQPVAGEEYFIEFSKQTTDIKSYYSSCSEGTLSDLKELPWGTLTKAYTSESTIWGECGGNAKESFVLKFYNDGTYMGYTSLNNVGGIINGNVNVTWHIKLDAASNADEYWTMAWEIAPTLDKQPNRVEQWVDDVKVAECAIELNSPDNLKPIMAAVADGNGKIVSYAQSLAEALEAAKTAGLTDVDICLVGHNTVSSNDSFNLYTKKVFNSVTLKQKDATKFYYLDELDTGSRTNGGDFIFDGVNICVTDQYIFEGNVKLTNNSCIKSTAEANCFFYYNTTTIEPGSKLQGVIEDYRGGTVIVDGGRNDGAYNEEADMQDSIMVIRWSGDSLTIKNGAYVKVNAANEVGRVNMASGTSISVDASRLDAVQYIDVASGSTLTVDTESQINTPKITGAGNIVIDAENYEFGKPCPVNANVSAFTGTVEVINNKCVKAVIEDGKIVFVDAVAKIGDQGYYTFEEAVAAIATDGTDTTIELLADVEIVKVVEFKYGTGKVTITAEEPVTVKQTILGSDIALTDGKAMNLEIGENVTIEIYDNSSGMYMYYGPSLTLSGTITGGQNWGCLYLFNGKHIVTETGKANVGRVQLAFNETTVKGEIDTNYLLVESGTFTADGATIDAGVIHDSNNGDLRWGASEFVIKNETNVTTNGLNLKYADSTLTIDMGSKLTASSINGIGKIIIDAKDYTIGMACPIDGNVSGFTGTVEVVNNKLVKAVIKEDKIVLVDAVAKIGDQGYITIEEAIAAANGETVTLLQDAEAGNLIVNGDKAVTIDLGGKTLTVSEDATFLTQGNLVITGEGVVSGTLTKSGTAKIALTGGTYDHDVRDFCADKYAPKNNGKGTWTVCPAGASVTVGGETEYYYSLVEAAAAAQNAKGAVITQMDSKQVGDDADPVVITGPVTINAVNKNNVSYGIVLGQGDKVSVDANGLLTVTAAKDPDSDYGSFAITKTDGMGNTIARVVFVEENTKLVTRSATTFDLTKADFNGEYLLDMDGNGKISSKDIYSEFLDADGNPMYALSIKQGDKVSIKVRNTAFFDTCTQIYVNDERIYARNTETSTKFKVSEGCTELELTADYVKDLSADDYKVTFYHEIDDVPYRTESTFKVYVESTAKADTTNPKTGDEIFVPMFMMLFSTAALAVMLLNKKKFF